MMKSIVKICNILVLSFLILLPSYNVLAAYKVDENKTLAQLRKDLASYKASKAAADKKQSLTKSEINAAKNSAASKQNEIENNQKKVTDATNEIETLEKEISAGKEELDKLVKNYQIASGDNLYLKYIFEAESYEDLIYRYAVMEQIMNFQEDKITSWKDKIERNEQLKVDLAAREIQLNDQIESLSKDIDKLNDALIGYSNEGTTAQQAIDSTQQFIKFLEENDCKENQNLTQCITEGDTRFIRPLKKGVITSVWGYRRHPVTEKPNTFHNGIDIGGNSVGTPIYPAANGTVGKIIYKSPCGGNQVYIYHNIKGKRYTTSYLHLNTINVKLGQVVKSTSVIGTVGGQKGTGDGCTTGAHLHFGMGTGWFGADYVSNSTWQARSVNPVSVISFPAKGKYFNSRIPT
ncbi:MAG: peptidoglycan DD-metalloendopeptidase family protein [Bacilli bacterium]|nr:peptidoglycan DD-metalloendopeptidase family protein [Bacilli bacterium]